MKGLERTRQHRRARAVVAGVIGVLALCAGSSAPATAATFDVACNGANNAPGAFADAGFAADCLKLYGISFGKADGSFGEDDALLRSQVSSLLARLIQLSGATLGARQSFEDVNSTKVPNAQVRDEIELLAGSGIITGYGDGRFGPTDYLTVAQAATLLVRALAFIDSQRPDAYDVRDQGSTGANYGYALTLLLLNPSAGDAYWPSYPAQASDVTVRGLLADMVAVSVQGLVDRSVVANRGGKIPPPVTTPPPVTQPPPSNCTPGYDPCIPPGADVDCAGGSGNGPRYIQGPVTVTGSDPYDLDSDNDGIGCEG